MQPSCSGATPAQKTAIQVMAAERLPVKLTCRILGASVSGYYDWRKRAPSRRDLRHAQLTSIIRQIHTDFRGVYGARRMHAELTLGRGIAVGREAVEMLMRRAGLQGVSGRRSYRHVPNTPTASDLVDRKFERAARDQLWVTDITDACSGPCRSPIPAQADH